MFFKMLKNDLRIKKGLNIILFIFIAAASVLMFISAAQLYIQLTGPSRTAEHCNTSDYIYIYQMTDERRETDRAILEKCMSGSKGVTGVYHSEGLWLDPLQADFDNVDEEEQKSFFENSHFVTPLPRECNLVYDSDDKPFYVKNGTVYISLKMKTVTGAEPGDTVRMISPMGRVYSFELAGFYKEAADSYLFRYIISDDDYAVLSEDFPIKADEFCVFTDKAEFDGIDLSSVDDTDEECYGYSVSYTLNDDYVSSYIVTVALFTVCVFMLIIILMTIRFTMLSAMREEEKEIGMMRAMGIDSFSFRWLFAAKYIFFALAGGVIGFAAGYPLSVKVMKTFSGNMTFPCFYELIIIGAVSVFLMAGTIILFSMFVMRRIKRISVINAIHGENCGERFGKTSALLLHRRSRMPVRLCLALSDILTRIKRYIPLIVTYTLSGAMILLTCYLYRTVIDTDFLKYSAIYQLDFFPDFNDEMMEEYDRIETAENKEFWEVYNDDLEKHGIAAHVGTYDWTNGELLTGGKRDCEVRFGSDYINSVSFSEGTAPVLANEAALSSYTAQLRGIGVGDEIDITVSEYSDDNLSHELVEHKVILTGLFDEIELQDPVIIMGAEYSKGCRISASYYSLCIDSEDKEAEYQKICEAFNGHTMTTEEWFDRYFGVYELPLRLLRNITVLTAIFVNIMLTMLYMNIFISEDKPEIALQRCIGFTDSSIRSVQLIRMLLLAAASVLVSILLVNTFGDSLVNIAFRLLSLTGFRFLPMPAFTWLGMPLTVILTVLIPSLIRLRSIDTIDIGSISEE